MSRFLVNNFCNYCSNFERNPQLRGREITRLGGDFDSILVASLLVASLPGGEMTSYHSINIFA